MVRKNWLEILVIILVIGMTVVGCDLDGTDDLLNGTWVSNSVEISLNNGNAETSVNDKPYSRWTYTTSNGKMTSNGTYIHGSSFNTYYGLESRWYSKEQLLTLPNTDWLIQTFFGETTNKYSVTSNTLTIYNDNGSVNTIYTRK